MNKGTGEGSGSGSELPGGVQSQGSAPTAPENGGAASGALWGAGEDAEGPPRGGGDALGIGCHLTVTERSGQGAEGGTPRAPPRPQVRSGPTCAATAGSLPPEPSSPWLLDREKWSRNPKGGKGP